MGEDKMEDDDAKQEAMGMHRTAGVPDWRERNQRGWTKTPVIKSNQKGGDNIPIKHIREYKELAKKTYWKILKNLINKSKAPKIPPLKVNDKFVMDCKEKAELFNGLFANQCKPNINDSRLPPFVPLPGDFLSNIRFTNADILSHLKNIDPNK